MFISTKTNTDFTQEVTFLKGQYSLWRYSIPYFSSVVDISFAKKYLHLVDDIPQSETINWSIHELFQRDVAWDRVNKEIASYLRNETRPQFFNALTIALIPKNGVGFEGVYEDGDYEKLQDEYLEAPTEVGGIQIYYYKNSGETAGRLRWDDDNIIAVAVDGQHRLAAIKQVSSLINSKKAEETKIPVIFIIPDEKAGFIRPKEDGSETIASPLRQIFTDLNKHARTVTRARQILLDDSDPVSVCVRRVIGEKLGDESEPERIPLIFVDWLSEKNKIENGPFLITITQLYEVVSTLIKIPDFNDFDEDDSKIRMWARRELELNKSDENAIMSQVKDCFYKEVPLTFSKDQIKIIVKGFFNVWGVAITNILMGLTDYKSIVDYMRSMDLVKPEFVNLYWAKHILSGDESEQKRAKVVDAIKLKQEHWREDVNFDEPVAKIDSEMKANRWPFMIVFQKAIFQAYSDLVGNSETLDSSLAGLSTKARKNDEFSKIFVGHINKLLDSELANIHSFLKGKEKFWQGTGLKSDETVEFTKVGRDRIAFMLKIWIVMASSASIPDFDDLALGDSPILDILYNLINNSKFRAGYQIIVRGRDTEADEDQLESNVDLMIKERFQKMKRLLSAADN